jgi:protein involved in polysaccharide export with SLBB domain
MIRHSVVLNALVVTGVLAAGNVCRAQTETPVPVQARREFESRAEIEAQAKNAEAQHRTGEAWLLRQRLEKGDFQDGDRIVVHVQGNALMPKDFAGIPETTTVRAGKHLEFPLMDDLSLDGVLRSELNDKLTAHFAHYIKDPSVRSTPLVRVAVIGTVGRPGYIYTLADSPLSDVIMQAGGPAADADMAAVVIKRGGDVIWDQQDTRAALADGMSLDRLHLRAGDEINVPAQRNISWPTIISVAVSSIALAFTVFRTR